MRGTWAWKGVERARTGKSGVEGRLMQGHTSRQNETENSTTFARSLTDSRINSLTNSTDIIGITIIIESC